MQYENRNTQKEFDGEARINCLFSNTPLSSDITSPARKNALSIRLDREGKERKNGTIVANDPTRQDGEVSLDIGGIIDPTDTSDATNLSRVIAIGNSLYARQHDVSKEVQQFHNRESFSREFGDADAFSRIVDFVKQKIEARFRTEGSH